MSLYDNLFKYYNAKKFAHSWIIVSSDIESDQILLEKFLSKSLFSNINLEINNNTDYMVISPSEASTKNEIKIDQIRSLNKFLSTTSTLSDCKVCVIKYANLMNLNSSNACLKILEDNISSHIFLLVDNLVDLLETIKSRCFILDVRQNNSINQAGIEKIYDKYLENLLPINKDNLKKHEDFLKIIEDKNNNYNLKSYIIFCLEFIIKVIKHKAYEVNLVNNSELDKINQFKNYSTQNLISKYNKLSKIYKDYTEFDIGIKHTYYSIIGVIFD